MCHPRDSVIYEKTELWELLKFPPELQECQVKISSDGLVLELTRKIGKEEKIAISQEAEWFLEFLADEWGSVCLKWEGYFKMFGENIVFPGSFPEKGVKSMSEPGSLINPENFDRLLRTQRIFGSALSGIDYPLLKALEKMVECEYPCSLITLEGTTQLWFNDNQLEEGLEVDIQEGTGRDVTNFWLPGDLEDIVKNVTSCDLTTGFDSTYRSVIFPPAWGQFDLHFERVESIIGTCRLTISKNVRQIPTPIELMRAT